MRRLGILLSTAAVLAVSLLFAAEPPKPDTRRGDRMIAEYFRWETQQLQEACLADVQDLADWKIQREEYRHQLLEMLGLYPLPERTDLQATVTGRVEHDEFTVENLHFQSRPGLYVTGNLYVPRKLQGRAPAVLYVCGHGASKKDGVSFGNKVTYQHHGGWFARHGYICLTIDTLQMGEIEGIHHGTYRYKMWWWVNRGYTPAGVEAWNCVRALDYLQTRPEVDPERIGVTGRSGGGAYSWWIAAIDERIQAAVPVAGITDLQNHVVDGCVEGHCDCMFMVNTYRWDYPLVAALVAPRPLLLSNTDRDGIFPLDGVVRTYERVRKIYELYGAGEKLGLHLTAGPHSDTQELQIGAFRWLNKHLKNDTSLIGEAAVKFFEPPQLKVFEQLPQDQRNTEIHESFVPAASTPPVPADGAAWDALREAWRAALLAKSFRGWPAEPCPLDAQQVLAADGAGLHFEAWDFTSQAAIRLRLYLVHRGGLERAESVVLNVLDEPSWTAFVATMRPAFEAQFPDEALPPADEASFQRAVETLGKTGQVWAYVAPRGSGPTAWDPSEKKQTQHQRRFYLLGQTLDGMRVWDVRRAMQAVRSLEFLGGVPLEVHGQHAAAGIALYAALFEPAIRRLDLRDLPTSHRDGPYLLNVRRYLDIPQAVAMAAERTAVVIHHAEGAGWEYPVAVAGQLGWAPAQLQVRPSNEGSVKILE